LQIFHIAGAAVMAAGKIGGPNGWGEQNENQE
jgi:hypothetical protein